MKVNYVFSIIFILFSCGLSKTDKQKKVNQNSSEISEEGFSAFYKRFSSDSIFRNSRTKWPLIYITIDTDSNSGKDVATEELLNIFPLELNKKKWREKVSFSPRVIDSFSAKVIIRIEDTGYHVVMYFIRHHENRKWYAVKVEDSST